MTEPHPSPKKAGESGPVALTYSISAFTQPGDTAACWFTRQSDAAITDANIKAAADNCRAESQDYNCPGSQATYGPISTWDTSSVTSFNPEGDWNTGRA